MIQVNGDSLLGVYVTNPEFPGSSCRVRGQTIQANWTKAWRNRDNKLIWGYAVLCPNSNEWCSLIEVFNEHTFVLTSSDDAFSTYFLR